MRGIRCFVCIVVLAISALGASQPDTPKPQPANPHPSRPEPGLPGTPDPAYPNIILITMDTTRADRMGFMGSKRGLTPNLDALARDSAVFTRAYSQAPLTPASHATIFTGTYPQYHQVLTFPQPLAKTLPFLPDILKAQGYQTGAFIGSMALDPHFGAPGFDRGFDKYDAGFIFAPGAPEKRYETTERRAGEVVKHAVAWLKERPQGPFFLWVHVFDPHDPYDPPEPYKTRYAKAPYDGEIAYVDWAMGNLFAELKSLGLYDGSVIAVTADHGESLGAHGEDQHGIFLYDETIHVPLLIKLPRGAVAGKRIEDRVELADIMPTLLEKVGIAVPEKVQGQSLLGFLEPGTAEGAAAAKAWRDRGAYSQADYGHLAFAWSAEQSLRTGKYLYIQAPRRELYDETADANAEHDLAAAAPAVADTLAAKVKDIQQKTTNSEEMPTSELDEARIQKLSALGYIARIDNPVLAASPEHGADPKDKIRTINALLRINDMLENHNCNDAVPALQKAIAENSNISVMHFFLGGCYKESKDYAKAVPEFRKAVELDPAFTHAEMNLGMALMQTQDYAEAATAFEHVAATAHVTAAHIFLMIAYAKLDRVPEEIRECRTVLQISPENYGGNLNLGRFLAESGDLEGAIPSLQKAASLRPTVSVPHMYLADVYTKLGREADADRERAEAERLGAVQGDQPPLAPDADPGNADQ